MNQKVNNETNLSTKIKSKSKVDQESGHYKRVALVIIFSSLLFALVILVTFIVKSASPISFSNPIDTTIFANYGTIVGSIAAAALSIASIFLLIQSIKEVRNNAEKQEIHSRFFELVKIHRENRNQIYAFFTERRDVFTHYIEEFHQIYSVVETVNNESKSLLNESERINISYILFYYGVFYETTTGNYSLQNVSRILKKYRINEEGKFISNLLRILNDKMKNNGSSALKQLFHGHQAVLGHYYRHFYQTVKYIDELDRLLTYPEKYHYVKTFRAQLSTQEQILFCFNSLSDLGKIWEIDPSTDQNRKLITKYNLIKNIPTDIYLGFFDIRSYYPNVFYERDDVKTPERLRLERIYS
jgi:hypothetical protein